MKKLLFLFLALLIIPFSSAAISASYSYDVNADDDSTNGFDGVVTGASHTTGGGCHIGTGCYDFDGTGDYIESSDSMINTSNAMSAIIWVANVTDDGDFEHVFGDLQNTVNGGIGVSIDGQNNDIQIQGSSGSGFVCRVDDSADWATITDGGWHMIAAGHNGTVCWISVDAGTIYTNTGAGTIIDGANWSVGARPTDHLSDFDGTIDQHVIFDTSITQSTINTYYAAGAGYNPFAGGTPSYATVIVRDYYDNETLEGYTVYIGSASNTTDASGLATIYNPTGLNYTVDGGSLYFNTSGTALENQTVNTTIYGSFVRLSLDNILNQTLSNFSVVPDQSVFTNTTNTGVARVYLKPNATNNLTFRIYDGNYSINTSQETYRNFTWYLNTTGKDVSWYNLTGAYQSLLSVNVSVGNTLTYIQNHTTNITGALNYTENTTNYNVYFRLLAGNYSLSSLPQGYSIANQNITIDVTNYTAFVTLQAFSLNSFYLQFRDEQTGDLITENMTLELISDLSAGTYTTIDGTLALEILAPSDYTLRYKSTSTSNYTERDYYQTLANLNYYNITLYSLDSDFDTVMLVDVISTGGEALEGAVVQLRRYYSSCNCYRVVEMAETAYTGEAFLIAEAYDGHYKLAVTYQGRTILTNTPENFVPGTSGLITKTITFDVGQAYYQSYTTLPNIDRSLTYNQNTGGLSFSWNDPTGLVEEGCLVAEYPNGPVWSQMINCQSSSSGNVVLTLPDPINTTYRYYANLETSTNYSTYTVFSGFTQKSGGFDFGAGGAFMAVMIISLLAIGGAFVGAAATAIFAVVGVIFAVALNLIPLGWSFVTGLAAFSIGMIIYMMRN